MIPSPAFTRHELLSKEFRAQGLSTTALHTIEVGPGKISNTLELLVAAAWAITEARWFYREEVEFWVKINNPYSVFRVRVSVGPEVKVESLLQQLERQMDLGSPGTSCSEEGLSRKFCIVYETEAAKGRNNPVMMLDCDLRGGSGLQMTISFSDHFQLDNVERQGRAIQLLLQQLTCSGGGPMMLTDLDMMSEQDLLETWKRNSTVPLAVGTPVHKQIHLKAREHPEAPAICARDGSLTYKELDDLATRVASGLIKMGVKKHVVVPLYFEKSKWMPVAILGVIKAGGVFLQLATSIPRGRIEAILSVDKPPFALVGPTEPSWLRDIVPTCTVHELLDQDNNRDCRIIPECSSGQDVVRLFTSGSTGQPKGIVWTHETLATNCQDIKNVLCLGPDTRLFQTASYEFDVSMIESIAVLISGGCLCIPLEHEGVNCCPLALEALQGNTVYLTPTIAGGLDPDTVPTLKHLALEGEILPKDVVSKWAGKATMYNFYGPAECPQAASCVINPETFRTGFAGSSAVCLRWVVDPYNHNKLMPSGAIGELVIEGPILLDRYVGGSVPASPFVTPTWLQRGYAGFPGRQGRLFKTGDLVQCDHDGNIVIIGRKDTQVQICAERVELSEVEHHVRNLLTDSVGVVAEMITPLGSSRPVLAAFLAIGKEAALSTTGDGRGVLQALTRGLEALAEYVPQTFIPVVYIAVNKIPLTAAGKTNRRELRQMGASMTLDQLAQLHLSTLGEGQALMN
ncbi:putative polyketide synthase [Aspergillus cavernicola]|uniref:Polyketide synthase n=1 Tax=Aspergillus cavernicola TaxID=176166 RepID=A0ABR4HUD2_9EURO